MELGVPVSVRVVEAVAERNGVDATELEPRLHEVIDPDALDALFPVDGGGADSTVSVSFTYAGCRVTVDDGGDVDVREPNAAAGAGAGRTREMGD